MRDRIILTHTGGAHEVPYDPPSGMKHRYTRKQLRSIGAKELKRLRKEDNGREYLWLHVESDTTDRYAYARRLRRHFEWDVHLSRVIEEGKGLRMEAEGPDNRLFLGFGFTEAKHDAFLGITLYHLTWK